MMRNLILSVSLLALMSIAAAGEDLTVSGCAAAGVEGNCITLKAGDKVYDITAAQPTPMPGTYGTVTGTLTDKVSACQQGQVVDPAIWQVEVGKQCPVETSQ